MRGTASTTVIIVIVMVVIIVIFIILPLLECPVYPCRSLAVSLDPQEFFFFFGQFREFTNLVGLSHFFFQPAALRFFFRAQVVPVGQTPKKRLSVPVIRIQILSTRSIRQYILRIFRVN